jgi:hypothetical protein
MLSLRRFVGAYTEGRLYQVWHFLTHRKKFLWGWGGFAKNQVTQVSNKKLKTVLLVLIILLINTQHAFGLPHYKPKHYKQYIVTEINNIDQAYCLIDLYHHESRFDPKAKNGSHYGIPQGRSEYLKTVGGIKQIAWGTRYIGHRYGWVDKANGIPNACKAWQHFQKKGWH